MGESHILDDEPRDESAGAMLRRGREAAGLDLSEIGKITKIPERHLQTMESGRFSDLPARAYAVGFARTYARAVGLDEGEIAQRVREELDGASAAQLRTRPNTFEPGDPARIPSSRLSWIAAGLAVAVVLVGFLFWRSFYSPAAELPPIVAEEPEIPTGSPAGVTAETAAAQVVFTATSDDVWVRLYDANGARLLEKSLALGESFEVPAGAESPLLWTARPEALTITVGGREVPRLAERQQTMKDVPVNAEALLARTESSPEPAAQGASPPLARTAAPAPRAVAAPPAPLPAASTETAAQDETTAENP